MSPSSRADARPPASGEGGFSVAEMVVAAFVGLMAIVGIWALFGVGLRRSASTDVRLGGVQGVGLLVERLEHDLRQIHFSHLFYPVEIARQADGSTSMAFFVYDAERSDRERARLRLKRIRYAYDAAKGAVCREEGGRRHVFPGTYERVVFGTRLRSADERGTFPYLELPPYRPGSGTGNPPWPCTRSLLTYQITCVPAEVFQRDPARRRPQDRTTVRGAALIPTKATSEKYHFWLPNPSSVPEPPDGWQPPDRDSGSLSD